MIVTRELANRNLEMLFAYFREMRKSGEISESKNTLYFIAREECFKSNLLSYYFDFVNLCRILKNIRVLTASVHFNQLYKHNADKVCLKISNACHQNVT